MKLKKLEIVGFKSFYEKASIHFTSGISAVVGPNGCGKSNIVDAIRWVMGEQSVKQLRGKNMEDVIFAGTKGNPPTNMAEVSVILLNDNGSSPEEFKDYSEIMVTRRLYRSGESAYLINRRPCRLKDIQNIFMGSGMGPRTYSIIQQGNIGAITDAGPLERRVFIEEASGVTRYKLRRTEALKKVETTGQNILRVNDIIAEVSRQMGNLDRQVHKAAKYKQHLDEIETIDIRLLIRYHDDLTGKMKENDFLLEELKYVDINHETQIKKIDAAIESIKIQGMEINASISSGRAEKHEMERKTDRMETELVHFKKDVERLSNEIIELSKVFDEIKEKNTNILEEIDEVSQKNLSARSELDQLRLSLEKEKNDSDSLRNHLSDLSRQSEISKKHLMSLIAEEAKTRNIFQTESANREAITRRLKKIDEEKLISGKRVDTLKRSLADAHENKNLIEQNMFDLSKKIEDLQKKLDTDRRGLQKETRVSHRLELATNKAQSSLSALQKMENNLDWYKDGVKAILKAQSSAEKIPDTNNSSISTVRTAGILADMIEPETGFETAVESSMGEVLQYLLVDDTHSCLEGIRYLKETAGGRTGFIPIDPLNNAESSSGIEKPFPEDSILHHVKIRPGFENIIHHLLQNVMVAKDMSQAISRYNLNGNQQKTIVSLEGDILSHNGIMIGGFDENASGILSKKQEIRKYREIAQKLTVKSEQRKMIQRAISIEVEKSEKNLEKETMEKKEAEKDSVEIEKQLYKIEEELKHAVRHLEIVSLEQEQMQGEEIDIESKIKAHHALLSNISEQIEKKQNEVAHITVDMEDISSKLERYNQKIIDLRLKITALNADIENNSSTLNRLKDFKLDSGKRLDQIATEKVLKREKKEQIEEKIKSYEKNLADQYDKINEVDQRLGSLESEYHIISSQLKESDLAISKIQSERDKTLQKIRLIELELNEKKIKLENIEMRSIEKYHHAIDELRARLNEIKDTSQIDVAEMEKKIATLKERLNQIGNVNLGAIDEFQKLKERYEFLTSQRDDLLKAIDDLHKVIKRINQITQERFISTFNQVNEKLQILFPRLFDGGKAQLEFTEPSQPLETGIEFMVHPPGKKLTRMSLLSGGEKALSAIAFIFAIFMIRPTSFCLMDEIDAPLDDANVGRFNELLKVIGTKSQIIMITHNKKSMEFADFLVGVTMEKKGISKIVSVNFENRN